MKYTVALLFAIFAVAMATSPAQTEEKKDLQASPSLLYGGLYGYPLLYGGIGKLGLGGIYGGYGIGGLGYGIGLRYGGLGYGGIIG